ncbi:hypothetical protein AB0O07_24305 [Streptomyces sp. NPDC093085]|uniref:hypothetical protein n=1 Tax=Streptomyces sp. NPDC093085 TaxID=3155068 RepID=UPI003430AAAB
MGTGVLRVYAVDDGDRAGDRGRGGRRGHGGSRFRRGHGGSGDGGQVRRLAAEAFDGVERVGRRRAAGGQERTGRHHSGQGGPQRPVRGGHT